LAAAGDNTAAYLAARNDRNPYLRAKFVFAARRAAQMVLLLAADVTLYAIARSETVPSRRHQCALVLHGDGAGLRRLFTAFGTEMRKSAYAQGTVSRRI